MTAGDGCTPVTPYASIAHQAQVRNRTRSDMAIQNLLCRQESADPMVQSSRSALTYLPPSTLAGSERSLARKEVPRHVRYNFMPRSPTALVRKSIYLPYIPQGICPMKPAASLDPASRSTGTYTTKIQEPEIRQTELANAPPCATCRIDSARDPALSPLGRAPVRRSSGMTPGAPLAGPGKDAQALGLQPLMSSSEAEATSAPQRQPSISQVAQLHPEHAPVQNSPSRAKLGHTSSEITRCKSGRDLEMEFHTFARRAGKHAKDLV